MCSTSGRNALVETGVVSGFLAEIGTTDHTRTVIGERSGTASRQEPSVKENGDLLSPAGGRSQLDSTGRGRV